MARQVLGALDLRGPLLLEGVPGDAGLSPVSQGPGLPMAWLNTAGNIHFYQDTKPTSGFVANDTWQDSSNPDLPTYRYIESETSSQWVQIVSPYMILTQSGSPTFIQATTPTVEQVGGASTYAWWQTIDGDLTLWIEDGL